MKVILVIMIVVRVMFVRKSSSIFTMFIVRISNIVCGIVSNTFWRSRLGPWDMVKLVGEGSKRL